MENEDLVFIDGEGWHAEECQDGYRCEGSPHPEPCPEWATWYLRAVETAGRRFLCDHHFEAARASGEKRGAAMTVEQEHLLHTLARAVLNLGWHVQQLRPGEGAREIEGYLEEVETALKEAVPGRKVERG